MTRPVIVSYKDPASPEGREYEVASAAVAKKAHPDAKIVRFAETQEPYSEDAPRTEEAARRASIEETMPAEAKAESKKS
jgi:hypothetical protein